jgi:putative transposase
MAEPDDQKINLSRQAKLLSINRTSLYRGPADSVWAELDLEDLRTIDEIYTAKPFYGYRRITEEMNRGGRHINRKRVRRLMRIMGIAGISTPLHQLRHIFTTYMHDFYDMLDQIGKEMLDHTGTQVTQGYDRPTFERKKKAALILEGVIFPESPPLPDES